MKHFTFIKRWSLMVGMLFLGFAASAQCTWTLNGQDSFGDGWNGGSLAITDGGVPVPGSPFAVSGSAGTWSFPVTAGNTIQLTWTGGGFLGEVSFQLLNDNGTTVFSQPSPAPGGTSVVYSGVITCIPCLAVPSGLFADNFISGSADLNWTGVFGATSYDVEWGAPGFTPGTGTEIGSIIGTANTTETASGFIGSTNYDFYVQSDCGTGWSLVGTFLYISCQQPSAFAVTGSDLSSGSFAWTENAGASEWQFEYGAIGFTQGSGTNQGVLQNPDTINGLAPYSFYEVYVQSVCGVGDSSLWTGPIIFNTYDQGLYMETDTECPVAGFTDIAATGVLNTLGDDGEVTVTLPFTILYQGTIVSNVTIGSNGAMVLTGGQQVGFSNGQMTTAANGLYPFWDDLGPEEAGEGVFYQTIGTAPNQQFIVQWNKDHLAGNGDTYIFQLVVDQATMEIFFVYEVVEVNSTPYDFGGSATIGVAGPNQDIQNSFNSTQYLTDNTCAHFYYTNCPKPQNYSVTYTTTNEAAFTWGAGLSNETNWTIIYGIEGFNPMTSGVTVQTTASALVLPGLDDVTTYDVYIYADCDTNLQSMPLTGQFTTLPNCADATGLAGSSAIDSIFTDWNFTANAGFPISEFAFEYGPTGFNNGTGTYVWGVGTTLFEDTIFDASLLSGGLYDVYIQSICNTDSSNWVGPITVTMPLTNDSTCLAEEIPVNGTVYTFDGTGATVAAGETAIAPGAGTCTGTTTWCNSSMNFTTWFTFTAPASGNVRIDGEQAGFDGQIAVYETTDCSSFSQYTMLGANDDSPLGGDAPYLNLCGLTPGNTYYLVHDPLSTISTGIYSLRIQDVVVEAGTDNGLLNICLGDTVDLSTQLSGADAGGMWTESIATANFNDPIWVSAGLASQVFDFEYMVVDGCATDSVSTQVEVYAPSSAGIDGTVTVCLNEPVNLLSGLSGNVDLGGTWYDPTNSSLPSSAVDGGQVPGQFNYDYIAGNGVCPNDTANVIMEVLATCNYLNLQEVNFEGLELFPNPTTNVFYISNAGSNEVYNYELTDLNGKVIASQEAAINGTQTTEVNVEDFETGVYLIRIFNENDEKTFRVVKQ